MIDKYSNSEFKGLLSNVIAEAATAVSLITDYLAVFGKENEEASNVELDKAA